MSTFSLMSTFFQAEELLQVAQVEIDKRHNLIMKLHANSNQMIDEYKNIELQKKCKKKFLYPGQEHSPGSSELNGKNGFLKTRSFYHWKLY